MEHMCIVSRFAKTLFSKKRSVFACSGWVLLASRFQNLSHPKIIKEIKILKEVIMNEIEWLADNGESAEQIYESLSRIYFYPDVTTQ